MIVLWPHTFAAGSAVAGIFMHRLAAACREHGVDVRLHPLGRIRRPGALLRARRRVPDAARVADLVHAQFGSGCGYAVAGWRRTALLTLRGSDWYGCPAGTLKDRLHGKAAQTLTRKALHSYARVITVSTRMQQAVARSHPEVPTEVLPDGVDLNAFRPQSRDAARAALGHPGDAAPWIGFASALDSNPIKRADLAEQTIEALRARHPNVTLRVIHGVAPPDVPQQLNACDALLLTSTHEGWPNIVKEALACNVPFVATDVSDLAAVAAAAPPCAIADADPVHLADALDGVLRAGRPTDLRRHVESMSLERTAAALAAIYQRVLDGQA